MTCTRPSFLLFTLVALAGSSLFACAQTEGSPDSIPGAIRAIYKTVGDTRLRLHIFKPDGTQADPRPAILFFFGGGWNTGTVQQFAPHARHFSKKGIVSVLVDYRVKSRHGVTPFDCVDDARAAMRWLHDHAADYNIDPKRIAAAGGSAGGHLAATTALITEGGKERTSRKYQPALLVLFNPAVDLMALLKDRPEGSASFEAISPIHHVRKGLPPTLIFHGTADRSVPLEQVARFCKRMKSHRNECEVVTFEGRGHGFFNANRADGADFRATLEKMESFLAGHGWMSDTASPER